MKRSAQSQIVPAACRESYRRVQPLSFDSLRTDRSVPKVTG